MNSAMFKMGLTDGIACVTKERSDAAYLESLAMLCTHMANKAKRQQDRDYWLGMKAATVPTCSLS